MGVKNCTIYDTIQYHINVNNNHANNLDVLYLNYFHAC